MAQSSERPARDLVAAGWAALGEGQWTVARRRFDTALRRERTPEALEGSSWAAWWLDDAATVFAEREEAHRLYRAKGEARGAARMATWLAADELDFRGATAVASGWLRRAHRLLDPLEPGVDHGWLAFHEGYVAHASGDTARARELAAAASQLGRGLAVPDLEMLGLALEGAALVASAEVEKGMRSLDEATTAALEGGAEIPIASAWTCCFLVTACTAAHDLERAAEWCERIAEFAARYGSRYMLAFCRAEYGTVYLWQGRWQEAETVLTASVQDFAASRPAWLALPLVGLAELRRRQGEIDEARRLLADAGSGHSAQLCRARLALDRGDALGAAELAERQLRQLPADRALDRLPALEVVVQARLARSELDLAVVAVDAMRDVGRRVGTPLLLARTDVAGGMLAAAHGAHEHARKLLEDAVDRFLTCGAPYEAARARLELAASLVALGRPDAAEREAAEALEALEALGAAADAARAGDVLALARGVPAAPVVTRRERDVLSLVAEGLTNRQIAERLVISEHTVHRHVTNILRKLDTPSRTAAAAYAVRTGLLEQSPP